MKSTNEQFSFDRDDDGLTLPTLRNKKIFDDLFEKYKSVGNIIEVTEKVQEILGEDYIKLVQSFMFDPRKGNVFFETEDIARKAGKRAELINRLDKKWLAESKKLY